MEPTYSEWHGWPGGPGNEPDGDECPTDVADDEQPVDDQPDDYDPSGGELPF